MIQQQQFSSGEVIFQQSQHLMNSKENIVQNTTTVQKKNKGGRPSTGRARNVQGKQNQDSFTLGSVIQLLGVSNTGDKTSVRFSLDSISNEFEMTVKQINELKEQVFFTIFKQLQFFSKRKQLMKIKNIFCRNKLKQLKQS